MAMLIVNREEHNSLFRGLLEGHLAGRKHETLNHVDHAIKEGRLVLQHARTLLQRLNLGLQSLHTLVHLLQHLHRDRQS